MQRVFVLAVLVTLSSIARATNDSAAPIEVTFLHVNDVYQFMPVEGGKKGGLARLLALKKQALKTTPHVVFTLGGDTLSPSAETHTYKGAQMVEAWNAIGLDYAVFGNHEFDTENSRPACENRRVPVHMAWREHHRSKNRGTLCRHAGIRRPGV